MARFLDIVRPKLCCQTMTARTILITGASSGIGAALAKALAGPGVRLLLWGRNEDRLAAVAAKCRARGAAVETASLDVGDSQGFATRLARADERNAIELAIFNAGLGGTIPENRVGEDPGRASAMMAVNFTSPVLGASILSERMAARGAGHIVLVGSISAWFPLPMAPTYVGTKAGLAMFSESLGMRMARHNVAVTLVSPGFIDTPMSQSVKAPKPFLMSAEACAAIIARRLPNRPAHIVVPWQFLVLRTLSRLLPRALTRAIINRH